MSLKAWEANGWIRGHEPSREEVQDLLAVVARDLRDAGIDGLSADWRLGIAYNAALQLATLALAAAGYRPGRERAHERALQSLRFTVGLDPVLVDTLDAIRRKRNISNYDRAGVSSPSEAELVYRVTVDLRAIVVEWLRVEHPHLATDI